MKSKVLSKSIITSIVLVLCISMIPFAVNGEDKYAILTESELQRVETLANEWQRVFIDENEKIQSCTDEDMKQYYIVKTIYNFAIDNADYDYDVRYQRLGCEQGTDRYRISHRIYGALFGNNQLKNINEYNLYTRIDNDGLTRLDKNKLKNVSQGLAVCEGFTELVKYFCNMNNIPCEIINGDYTKVSLTDPHAWNVVYLRDNDPDTNEKKWFYIDATYGRTSLDTIHDLKDENGNYISFVDYYYFLRGTESPYFKGSAHQQPYTDFVQQTAQEKDYKFWDVHVACESSWKIVTRRVSKDEKYTIDNYSLISPDGKNYKIDEDTMTLVPDLSMEYDGETYYYSIKLQDFADGIEYFSPENRINEVSDNADGYVLAYQANGENINFYFRVEPLDMGKTSSTEKVLLDGEPVNNAANIVKIPFKGVGIVLSVEVYDKAEKLLVNGTHYKIRILNESGKVVEYPCDIGTYTVVLDFNNMDKNYKGEFIRQFRIVKADFSGVRVNDEPLKHLTYGDDIIKGTSITSIGNITFYAGEGNDYLVTLEDPSKQNYGDSGRIKYTALASSKYFLEGTVLYRSYTIENQRDLSSTFKNLDTNIKVAYTGKQIKPDPKLSYKMSTSKLVTLKKGTDYDITGYENNINVGTGYIKIKFKGNYKGTAKLKFTIAPSGRIDVTAKTEYKYTGKQITPSVTLKADNITLVKGKDYTVSNPNAKAPGVYSYTVKGMGSYKINSQYVMYVLPGEITGAVAECTGDCINLSWDNQGGICTYEIYGYDTGKKSWKLIGRTNSSSYKFNAFYSKGKVVNLKSGNSYKLKIRAKYEAVVNGERCTKNGKYKEFTIKYVTKAPKLKSLKKGNKKLTAKWSKYSGASGYSVETATDSAFKKNKKVTTVSKGSTTSATVKDLKANKKYYVRFRAYTTSNGVTIYSPYSKAKSVTL